ncbi:sigma 54-interacting transcriptional regulator [Bacillus rubiinfantis]|uniref:sigma 54-interacting transcriptional regulator n=1 Tax=Bacillus rubiinfantis TaxID=1499680 RepID=UPI0005A99AB7|nr:sigma-54-dependent transcriptional regulator [Bacillus rubiinfantis]
MSLKERLLAFLEQETTSFDWDNPSEKLTASSMSACFVVKRNTVSHYLNQLVEEGRVIKINTRPVYFLSRSTFEQKFFPLLSTHIFQSFQELQAQQPEPREEEHDIFSRLIGADGSLKKAIEQIKTSIYYPGTGLPLILVGPTGVGKSFTAGLIHRYSVEKGIIDQNAPFISFNCAQYANNPELMSSNLFGYVKGAFTGAEKTKDGLLAAADGGILFLDEVHRLNAEGQEKLFTFLDQGVYRRMGESEGNHHANVRLIFATTEDLAANFLPTFLRRIPIRVTIPSLDERGEKEKRQFVYMFLLQEAQKLGKPLQLTRRILEALTSYHYPGNMGDLKNTIQYIAGSSFAKNREAEEVRITLHHLPDRILEETLRKTDYKVKQNHDIVIAPDAALEQLTETNLSQVQLIKKSFAQLLLLYEEHQAKKLTAAVFEQKVFQGIQLLFDQLIFTGSKEDAGVWLELTTISVQEIIQFLETNYHVQFNGNSIYAIAHFLYYKGNADLRWHERQESMIEQLANYIEESYKLEQQLANHFVHLLESRLEVKLEQMDEIFLSLYLRSVAIERSNQQVKAIILAHGYATASSIANVANRLLKKNVFEAFDMPLDISVEEIAAKVYHYIEHHDISKGLILLVDMGSLKDIHAQFKQQLNGPVAIINNVSTQMALFLGSMLEQDLFLEEMLEKLRQANQTEYNIIYPEKAKEKVIITTCLTGMGTALQIQKLLEASMPADLALQVQAYDFERLKELGSSEAIFQLHDVLAIVGTANPGIADVPYLSLEDIISGQGEATMRKIFLSIMEEARYKEINDNLLRNFSLQRVIESLTILDSEKILSQAEEFIHRLEIRLNQRLPNDKKVALYVHVSCLVERLIRQAPIDTYEHLENFEQCQKEMIKYIQEAFSVIESIYNVKINTAEIGYIYDYLAAVASDDEDF